MKEIRKVAQHEDADVLEYLRSKGHDAEKAKQILGNHREAVLQEMSLGAAREANAKEKEKEEKEPAQEPSAQ